MSLTIPPKTTLSRLLVISKLLNWMITFQSSSQWTYLSWGVDTGNPSLHLRLALHDAQITLPWLSSWFLDYSFSSPLSLLMSLISKKQSDPKFSLSLFMSYLILCARLCVCMCKSFLLWVLVNLVKPMDYQGYLLRIMLLKT